MLETNARLILTSVADGDACISECGCFYREIPGGSEITYEEGENRTVIRICRDRAEVERSGEYSGLMVIEPERAANCCMHTPYGRTDIEITGGEISFEPNENGLKAAFSYTSGIYGGDKSEMKLAIDVKIM
jgi:uncharacterized beta-barrel protein YwiB (DUF1934 family)